MIQIKEQLQRQLMKLLTSLTVVNDSGPYWYQQGRNSENDYKVKVEIGNPLHLTSHVKTVILTLCCRNPTQAHVESPVQARRLTTTLQQDVQHRPR